MEEVKIPIHKHPLLPITRFSDDMCRGCGSYRHIYGGYRCSELGCQHVFHRECAESLPEINHFSHDPDHHPLKLLRIEGNSHCSLCSVLIESGYFCSVCDFELDLRCARRPSPLLLLENSNLHQHPLELFSSTGTSENCCKRCDSPVLENVQCYVCQSCEFFIHEKCAEFFPEASHTSHPQHPLKLLKFKAVSDYADEKCLLFEEAFDYRGDDQIHHCDVCNFSICTGCMKHPPPVRVESLTTHEHQLHLVPRRIDFTCNACGTQGDRSPYFCLQCNFMIHRQCIDLPRVININRHDHRISYTPRLGHGEEEWKCKVCRKKVDGFYGAYTCRKCPNLAVHSRCATRNDVWDMVELEGTPDEEEEIPPFEVIDEYTIKHLSHDHNLQINNNGHDRILPDNIVCEACLLQIISEPFYSCKQCNFILHEKCANHPRTKRHFISNQPFTLLTDFPHEVDLCVLCWQKFTGFRYIADDPDSYIDVVIDVRCAAISDALEHESHQHPLYYSGPTVLEYKNCCRCGDEGCKYFRCDECDYTLDRKCALLPKKVVKNRYDDHPLVLSFGDIDVDSSDYWCEACEGKVNPKEWFYTCNECGTILHIYCVVGDFSYIMPGSHLGSDKEVVSNTSVCRPICSGWCNSRCKLPSILKISTDGVDAYVCSTSLMCTITFQPNKKGKEYYKMRMRKK